ncbi:MAG TPA: DUF5684 domain-containing protein [Actinomycetota bacterium]|nr:DUF5684 domain-containing protein [Actinomycetota bacterium]
MLAQTTVTYSSGGSSGTLFLWFVILYVVFALPYFAIFRKADKPGWAAFIPIYNLIVLLEVVGRPVWWIILLLIPIVNIIILIIVDYDLSKSFGHGVGFLIGLIFLSWIFLMILGFGSSQYRGPAAGQAMSSPPAPPPPMPAS